VTHPFTPDLGLNHFHAAFLANHPPVLHALVFAAVALIILGGAENLGAEKAVPFRFKGPVINGLGLLYLSVGPAADPLRRGERDPYAF
jgi:hypothetical protein